MVWTANLSLFKDAKIKFSLRQPEDFRDIYKEIRLLNQFYHFLIDFF